MNPTSNLSGQFLLAMPGIGDPRFERSVIAVCAHDPAGAFGLCLNQSAGNLGVVELMRQLDIDPGDTQDSPVLVGGPMEPERGFVLHSPDFAGRDTRFVAGRWAVTGTSDVLTAIAQGNGPRHFVAVLGYAGWGEGQLDDELAQHGWFSTIGTTGLIWDTRADARWNAGFAAAGIDSTQLSTAAGRA